MLSFQTFYYLRKWNPLNIERVKVGYPRPFNHYLPPLFPLKIVVILVCWEAKYCFIVACDLSQLLNVFDSFWHF